ncbi:hypothetical protein GCM10023229_00990 [Flavisolibacter ginsenosidimutans]
MEGFFKVEVAPLPKSQNQVVGLPVDASEKLTTSGEQPDAGTAVKLAAGVCAHTIKDRHTQISVRMVDLRNNYSRFYARWQALGLVDF